MFLLGLQGSPRLKGNTNTLLRAFTEEAKRLGADTRIIHITEKNIEPCKEYIVCEKKGFCPIQDDMARELYPLLRRADVVVAATPIFFYNCTAQLKALIDRCQTFWARKYKLNLKDPGCETRRGYLLAVGATKGKHLFEGLNLTASYFFDAIDARFEGSLTYRGIEHRKDMEKHPTMREDVRGAVETLLHPLMERKKLLFLCRDNSFYSQIAGAYAQNRFGTLFDVSGAGIEPAENIHPLMQSVMQEDGIDMAFRIPQPMDVSTASPPFDWVVTLGEKVLQPAVVSTDPIHWKLPAYSDKPIDFIRKLRDEIKNKVMQFCGSLKPS
jgi:multimeric flavodoxin WrbA/protein-tyrosine-phosphatase